MKKKNVTCTHTTDASWLLSELEAAGHRHTKPREAVCAYLETCHGMVSAKVVQKALPKLDRVSIYRTLELLAELDLIHPTLIHEGHQLYELHPKEEAHHHHAICTICASFECVSCAIQEPKTKQFTSVHHATYYSGVCDRCAKKR